MNLAKSNLEGSRFSFVSLETSVHFVVIVLNWSLPVSIAPHVDHCVPNNLGLKANVCIIRCDENAKKYILFSFSENKYKK